MEERLKEFKARRRRKNLLCAPKMFFIWLIRKISFVGNKNKNKEINKNDSNNSIFSKYHDLSFQVFVDKKYVLTSWITLSLYFLHILLWVIAYAIALQLEFGFVYFLSSALVFIYYNTRTKPKEIGEPSAYSIFNPGCEAIEGTLKAEHFEKEFNFIQYNKSDNVIF